MRAPLAPAFAQHFTSTPRGARLARHLAVLQLENWGVPPGTSTSDAVASIVGELTANAVRHGSLPGRDFELRLIPEGILEGIPEGTGIRIEVADTRGDRTPRIQSDPQGESGRGLLLVRTLASSWGVTAQGSGKTVWAVRDLSGWDAPDRA
ncbi:ATP-binding protein [Streptomyces sp. NBC_00536]|uniref:ATP-binding protein n=1 Tax=Streptomyces sp. NBC_00536 TaxID=2975769 RepID=UPI002E815457|nr:ATP-binding protein [Streptomyces sp. NBC_00536]WUC80964.1 ATP-binding protein [Streptomyces sp. NBC_00536]